MIFWAGTKLTHWGTKRAQSLLSRCWSRAKWPLQRPCARRPAARRPGGALCARSLARARACGEANRLREVELSPPAYFAAVYGKTGKPGGLRGLGLNEVSASDLMANMVLRSWRI